MKSSVLILDDVWENTDLLKVGCPVSVGSFMLIITTRSLEVCHRIRCQEVIRVEKLHEDEAWKLFIETLADEIEQGSQVEEIAKSMAKLCDGLPLAIITVAGSMRGETLIYRWMNALVKLKEYVMGQDDMGEVEVFKVLKYSFDRLNRKHRSQFNSFQQCFLYCSLYAEDAEIFKDSLVREFITDGLLDLRKSRRAQVDQAYSILHTLVNVCLLESCVDENGYECVKMHDLVRGMALKICEGKYMVRAMDWSLKQIIDEEEWTKSLEKVSLMDSGLRIIRDGVSPNCPHLSTLLLGWNPSLKVIPNSFFSKMQGLCTLDLRGNVKITTLPDSIADMTSLKALVLKDCNNLETVPDLGKLKALRELDLSCTAIKEVPRGVDELLNLRFLSFHATGLEMLPRGLFLELRHLQHVHLPPYTQVEFEEMENLKQLEEFHGRVKSIKDFNCLVRNMVDGSFWYVIGVGSPKTTSYILGKRDSECYKSQLMMSECSLVDEKVLGRSIVYLTISECEGLSTCFADSFCRSSYPTSLKSLVIESCGGVEFIFSSEQGTPIQSSETLEYIWLQDLEDLKVVIKREEIGTVFSSLKGLIIGGCNKMRKVELRVSGVPNLEYVEIRECGIIEEIFEDEGRGPVTLSKLKELWLEELPRLKRVCEATMICNSIEMFVVKRCPRLMKKLPLHLDVSPPPSMRYVVVEREWWETLEWDNPHLPQLLQPLVSYIV